MLHQVVRLGETIIPLKNGAALVASKTTGAGWHVVQSGQCDCLGYQHRGVCRHLQAVQSLQSAPSGEPSRSTALAATTTSAPEPERDTNRSIPSVQEIIGYTA